MAGLNVCILNKKMNVGARRGSAQNGITLVSLIVTIIILIILAGITLNVTLGENGIFKKSKEAVDAYKLAAEKEQMELEKTLVEMFPSGGTVSEIKNEKGDVVVRKISDGQGKTLPVPNGFYYVGGTVENGAVISDEPNDQNKYTGYEVVGKDLKGNQFVFVPVDGKNIEYKQDHTYDSKHQWEYTNYTDWSDEGGNKTSVDKYGGFYIGRYEAGWSEEVNGGDLNSYKTPNETHNKPISKANVPSWNWISQANAQTVSENMYGQDSTVESKLIDSYAWDTTVNWLKNSGIITELADGRIDSTKYGNYYNSGNDYKNSVFYQKEEGLITRHIYLSAKSGTGKSSNWYWWLGGENKEKYEDSGENRLLLGRESNITVPTDATVSSNDYIAEARIEIATGSSEYTRTNNIYDLAGNMWEWTTEKGKHKKSDGSSSTNTYTVLRGGGFDNSGNVYPVVCRSGGHTDRLRHLFFGFRVALYIK